MLALRTVGSYEVLRETLSSDMIFIPKITKIHPLVRRLLGNTHTYTHSHYITRFTLQIRKVHVGRKKGAI